MDVRLLYLGTWIVFISAGGVWKRAVVVYDWADILIILLFLHFNTYISLHCRRKYLCSCVSLVYIPVATARDIPAL